MNIAKEILFHFMALMTMVAIMVVIGLVSFALPWWLGLIFIVVAFSFSVAMLFPKD